MTIVAPLSRSREAYTTINDEDLSGHELCGVGAEVRGFSNLRREGGLSFRGSGAATMAVPCQGASLALSSSGCSCTQQP